MLEKLLTHWHNIQEIYMGEDKLFYITDLQKKRDKANI